MPRSLSLAAPPPPALVSLTSASAALQAHRALLLRLDGPLGGVSPKQPAGPSLAQRLGLVPGPPPPLSPAQWLQVHLQSQRRCDSAGDCSICLRPFRAEGQVLLSCSHTYHERCLASLERFARQQGGAGAVACPLCRAAAYEKRRIDDAERLWRHACAARIQAAWRGLQARRAYRALRRLLPPTHPALRRRWAAEALEDASAPLVKSVECGTAELDALFAELDATSEAAGAVYRELSSRCPCTVNAAGEGGGSQQHPTAADSSASSSGAESGHGNGSRPSAHSANAVQAEEQQQQQQPDWEAVICRCLQRDERPECAICLAPLGQLCVSASGRAGGAGGKRRGHTKGAGTGGSGGSGAAGVQLASGIAVLSCSHAYHADCLSSFEAFAVSSDLVPACPCCRSAYTRLDLC